MSPREADSKRIYDLTLREINRIKLLLATLLVGFSLSAATAIAIIFLGLASPSTFCLIEGFASITTYVSLILVFNKYGLFSRRELLAKIALVFFPSWVLGMATGYLAML